MKLKALHSTLFLAVLLISVSSCDMKLEMEEDQPLFLRFQNMTHLTMDNLEVEGLDIGQLEGNTKSDYIEFEQLFLDANVGPKLDVSSMIEGLRYINENSIVQSNPTVFGSCGTGHNCNHSSTTMSSTSIKKIESGLYTIKISANKLPNDEGGQDDLKLILSIEQD